MTSLCIIKIHTGSFWSKIQPIIKIVFALLWISSSQSAIGVWSLGLMASFTKLSLRSTIGYGPLATKRHFFLVVAIYTNSVHTDYSIKTYKTAILKFSMVPIKKCYLTKLYKIKIVTNLLQWLNPKKLL